MIDFRPYAYEAILKVHQEVLKTVSGMRLRLKTQREQLEDR